MKINNPPYVNFQQKLGQMSHRPGKCCPSDIGVNYIMNYSCKKLKAFLLGVGKEFTEEEEHI